ncbi:MAG: CTP synthetase [Halobacteriaceae archaeon]
MKAVVAGPDRGIADALEAEGVAVSRLDGAVTAAGLEAAGIADADLFVLTDAEEATAIPVARELNPGLRLVAYAPASLPEFAGAQVDLAVRPGVLDAAAVAEELAGTGPDL